MTNTTTDTGGMRVKRLLVSPEFIVDMSKNGGVHVETTNGLPEDAKYVSQYFDPERACISIVIKSESFPEIAQGDIIPVIENPAFRTIRDETTGDDISRERAE